MQLKPTKWRSPKVLPENIAKIMSGPGKFLTEAQLAEILDMNVQKAIIEAARLKFSRIPVKRTHYYSKKQVQAHLNKP